jgi:hypothetical protein
MARETQLARVKSAKGYQVGGPKGLATLTGVSA